MLQPINSEMENVIDSVNFTPTTVPLSNSHIKRKFMHFETESKAKFEMNLFP